MAYRPLADEIRPSSLDDVVGQGHILGKDGLLRRIIAEGQAAGELTQSRSVNDMVKVYALCERALMYDWCLCGGDYSLAEYAARQLPVFLHDFLPGTSSENRSEEIN